MDPAVKLKMIFKKAYDKVEVNSNKYTKPLNELMEQISKECQGVDSEDPAKGPEERTTEYSCFKLLSLLNYSKSENLTGNIRERKLFTNYDAEDRRILKFLVGLKLNPNRTFLRFPSISKNCNVYVMSDSLGST